MYLYYYMVPILYDDVQLAFHVDRFGEYDPCSEQAFRTPSSRITPLSLQSITLLMQRMAHIIQGDTELLELASELRDHSVEHYAHSLRVGTMFVYAAQNMGLTMPFAELTVSGYLHDVGKIKVCPELLHSRNRFGDGPERRLLNTHNTLSYLMLYQLENRYPNVAQIAVWHHPRSDDRREDERRDVTPRRDQSNTLITQLDHQSRNLFTLQERRSLSRRVQDRRCDERREDKPTIQRAGLLLAVCDTYDALSAQRMYKPALGIDEIANVIGSIKPMKQLSKHYPCDGNILIDLLTSTFAPLSGGSYILQKKRINSGLLIFCNFMSSRDT
jgi:hypothetical protein